METYRYLLEKSAPSTVPRLLDGTESGEALPGFSSKYSIVQEVGVTVRMLKPWTVVYLLELFIITQWTRRDNYSRFMTA